MTITLTAPEKTKPSVSTGSSSSKDSGPFSLGTFVNELKQEWKKITWPSRQQVIAETIVVLVVVAFFSVLVFAADKLFQFFIDVIT